MTLPEIAFASIVLLVGIPAGVRLERWRPHIRNLTAFALVLSWSFGQAVWLATGNNLPLRAYMIADLLVIGAVYCKPEWNRWRPYRDWRDQLRAFWFERSPWDRAILAIFGLAWLVYAIDMDPYRKWALLWWLTMAQFIFAGWEALHSSGALSANTSRVEATDSDKSERRAWGLAGHG